MKAAIRGAEDHKKEREKDEVCSCEKKKERDRFLGSLSHFDDYKTSLITYSLLFAR
jgi:hypothetical protein